MKFVRCIMHLLFCYAFQWSLVFYSSPFWYWMFRKFRTLFTQYLSLFFIAANKMRKQKSTNKQEKRWIDDFWLVYITIFICSFLYFLFLSKNITHFNFAISMKLQHELFSRGVEMWLNFIENWNIRLENYLVFRLHRRKQEKFKVRTIYSKRIMPRDGVKHIWRKHWEMTVKKREIHESWDGEYIYNE